MNQPKPSHIIPLMFLFFLLTAFNSMAQKFEVSSFRLLPNDVTAFINPVNDLNGDPCALLKVQSSEDFAFSTPLGIVNRTDKTGEIWLYIPKGSKKITLKHPQWGVLRDYPFPMKIESHMTYEMKVDEPVQFSALTDTIRVVNTVTDTLVLTRVDTLVVDKPKQRIPFSLSCLATAGFGGRSNTLSGGLFVAAMKRHGGWVHVLSDFGRIGATTADCDKNGAIDGKTPYYTGKTRHSFLMLTAGAIHRLSKKVNIFEGIGYGYNNTAWQLSEAEGGGFVKNSYYSTRGIAFEIGATISIKRCVIGASVSSISGRQWFGSIGIGYKFGK